MVRVFAACFLFLMTEISMYSQDRWQARSMVITKQGIVATSQTLASQAGAQVLARGGSAVDAAIAANAVMNLVEPMSNGIGGDLFAIYYDSKTGTLSGMNASGWAPKGLTIDYLKRKGETGMPQTGIDTVTVPGCVSGWDMLHKRFGRLPWAELFRPAIWYAENGFPVTEIIHDYWTAAVRKLESDANARRVFLPGGQAPATGQVFRNTELAQALRLIAKDGAPAFYRGAIAAAILKTSARHGGVLAGDDLAQFEAEFVTPISTTYRGWKVYELPPNGQGIATLERLNLMERFPIPEFGPLSVEAFHTKMEAQKLAYADLKRYVGDPRFARIPVEWMISKEYAAERAKLIDPGRARCEVTPGTPPESNGDTIYLSAVDKDGNIVSLIQSLYMGFGSGICVDGYGFHLQNRGALFTLEAGHPNVLAPRKRPFHTIIPGFMEKGTAHIGFGIMGGLNQAQAHAQFVSNIADHGMNLQGALESPRFTKMTFDGCDVKIERRVPEEVRSALEAKGHKLEVLGDYSGVVGGGQATMHDTAAGVNYGASSPRKDGAAVPEPAPYFK